MNCAVHGAPATCFAVVGMVVLGGEVDFVVDFAVDVGVEVGVCVTGAADSPLLAPGRITIKTITTTTARSPSTTISRRRQYVLLGCGPTGCLIVDMHTG